MQEMRKPLLDDDSVVMDVPPARPAVGPRMEAAPGSVEYNVRLEFNREMVVRASRVEEEKKKEKRRWKIPTKYDLKEFWTTKGLAFVVFLIWIIINAILFGRAVHVNRDFGGTWYQLARGGGAMLNFNCALILLPMLRNVLTRLRRTFLHNFFPWDSNITFHRNIAWMILAAGTLHGVAHYMNYRENNRDLDALFTRPGMTGHFIVLVMVLMYTSAQMPFKRPHFNTFFLTHHLFIVFYILLLIHAVVNFWKWFLGAALLYIIERLAREYRGKRNVRVLKVIAHPSDVLEIHLQKKRRFIYSAGQYLFLNCPFLSRYEWHPFTITTAPGQDYVSCHIRCVGPWTKGLRDLLNPDGLSELEIQRTYGPDGQHLIRVDGPFGSASEDVFRFKTTMLIGAGIGVTPFASILRAIILSLRNSENGKLLKLKKVYFYWICREYTAFEWFRDLLKEIEVESKQRNWFIEINIFFTGQLKLDRIKEIVSSESAEEFDPVTSLESRTNYGRPNWDLIFSAIRERHQNQEIGVFFCGPKELSSKLRRTCADFTRGSETHGSAFVFHKENF